MIVSFLAVRSGRVDDLQKKAAVWNYIQETDEDLYNRLRRGVMGSFLRVPGKAGRSLSQGVYWVSQKIYGFN